jgi:hypothetical protein
MTNVESFTASQEKKNIKKIEQGLGMWLKW